MTTKREIVRHFAYRIGALNGYRFEGRSRGRWMGESKEKRTAARRQYVIDMRWVREAMRHGN